MGTKLKQSFLDMTKKWASLCMLLSICFFHYDASAFTLNVVDQDGNAVTGFRWLLEEDTTYNVVPGVMVAKPLSVRHHTSHAPVISSGTSANTNINVPSNMRYFISVLPDSGHSIAGAPVAIGQNSVKVIANKFPLPTAQISVFVFEDKFPINNAPDLPQEEGLGGFNILVYDAGGRYGHSGGRCAAHSVA